MNTQVCHHFLFCQLFLHSFLHQHTIRHIRLRTGETTYCGACTNISVCVVTFSCKMWSNVTYGPKKERDVRQRERDSDRGGGKITPLLLPPGSRRVACVCVCVVNEFWELSSLYDSCNWPEDSCYYTLQQGNTVCEWASVCVMAVFRERNRETLWPCTWYLCPWVSLMIRKIKDVSDLAHLEKEPF